MKYKVVIHRVEHQRITKYVDRDDTTDLHEIGEEVITGFYDHEDEPDIISADESVESVGIVD